MTNTFELGGHFLRQEYKGDPSGDQESKAMEIRYTRSN